MRKSIRGEPSNVLKYFGYRKFLCKRRTYHFSPLKNFLPRKAEQNSRDSILCCRKFQSRWFSCVGKVGPSWYCGKKLCLTGSTQKTLWGNCLLLQKNSCIAKTFLSKRRKNKKEMLLSETENVSEVAKRSHTAEIRNPIYHIRHQNVVVATPLLTFLFQWETSPVLDWTKKEKQP